MLVFLGSLLFYSTVFGGNLRHFISNLKMEKVQYLVLGRKAKVLGNIFTVIGKYIPNPRATI